MDRSKISFAEAEGKAKFPAVLKWGEIDQRLRSALWTPIYLFLHENIQRTQNGLYCWSGPAKAIMLREFLNQQHGFIDDYKDVFHPQNHFLDHWKKFFADSDYVDIFNFITFLIRDPDCPNNLISGIVAALDQPHSPYRLSRDATTIFPAMGEEQTNSLQKNLEVVFSSPFSGSRTHIQAALKALGEGEYRTTVRESIHSVESAVRDFTGDSNAVLSKAIKSLVAEMGIHKALADAFDKLYAYSSDERGIRHALVFGENEKVGLDEAAFFLSACTAFVGFLSNKKQLQGTKNLVG
jgi:hypothetical protein